MFTRKLHSLILTFSIRIFDSLHYLFTITLIEVSIVFLAYCKVILLDKQDDVCILRVLKENFQLKERFFLSLPVHEWNRI